MTSNAARAGLRAGMALALFAAATPVVAQGRGPGHADGQERVREAAAHEAAGDYAAADTILRQVLLDDPSSLSALLAWERVLTLRRRAADLLPVLDTLLAIDPTSTIAHQLRVRTLSALNQEPALERAAEEWLRVMPGIETPYREIARVWTQRGAIDRAVRVLERGRQHVGRGDALALELGDAWAAAGNAERAADEWSRAVGPKGEAFLLVQRRLSALPDGGASVTPHLVDALVGVDPTPARTRAAVQLAIMAGMHERAEHIATRLLPRLDPATRRSFLIELSRRADGAGMVQLALLAYGLIVSDGVEGERLLSVRGRMAELALALGDTARAAALFRQIEDELIPGSPQRRLAMALRVQMLARESSFDTATIELNRLMQEPGGGPESDMAAAVLANALIDAGDTDHAERMLDGLEGAHARLAKGRLLMTRGDVERARLEILAAAPRLEGPEATQAIRLAALLGRLSADGGALMSQGLAALAAGDAREGVIRLYEGSQALHSGERAAILDFAAGLADRIGLDAEAALVRRDIIAETPDSPEAPPALLALAMNSLAENAVDEARLLLERLVHDYPRSALTPQARRELTRLGTQKIQP